MNFTICRINVNESCWYKYPYMTGIENGFIQSSINDMLAEAIEKPYFKDENINSYTGPVIGEIPRLDYIGYCKVNLCNDRMISITFCVYKFWNGSKDLSSNPFTLNLDLHTGKEISIESFYKVDKSFLNTIIYDGYEIGAENLWGYVQNFRQAELKISHIMV